jgi:hypothetical protein
MHNQKSIKNKINTEKGDNMIAISLLEKLLVAFPEDTEKIKEYTKNEEYAELRALLLKSSGVWPMPRFDKEIKAFKDGRFSDIPTAGERNKRFFLAMEAVKAAA